MRLSTKNIYIPFVALSVLALPAGSEAPKPSNLFERSFVSEEYFHIAESEKVSTTSEGNKEEPLVLISEVLIEGIDNHPDEARLRNDAYDVMKIRPGIKASRLDVKNDLNAIYSTGWFTSVKIKPVNTPLGVRLLVQVVPNPVLTKVIVFPANSKLTNKVINDTFKSDFGKIVNLNIINLRIKSLERWYKENGYSLARISGPNRISPEGLIEINSVEGAINDVKIQFLNADGNAFSDEGDELVGKTKKWVIEREMISKSGLIFNRKILEEDIKRLYGTSLFSDIKVTLEPVPISPGAVNIVLGISEQRTGSLTGGFGYSGGQGLFGQASLQETNLIGRAWISDFNFTYGEYGALIGLSLVDPWIKGDKYRTRFKTSVYISRDVPQEFRSDNGPNLLGVSDYLKSPVDTSLDYAYDIDYLHSGINSEIFDSVNAAAAVYPNVSWFDYEGDSIVLKKTGGGFSFSRPFNGGNPFIKAKWKMLYGMDFKKVRPVDYSGEERPYGVANSIYLDNQVPNQDIICVAFNCASENTLISLKTGFSYDNLNNSFNPTDGDYLTINSEQFISVGENSPTFNRAQISYSYFVPTNLLKLHKDCRLKTGQNLSKCDQAFGFQVETGAIVGDLPPYEAFCLGGSKSVRGWSTCDLAVSKRFGEATAEYRFPIWKMISGNLFVDVGTDFGSQVDVPGEPGKLLNKPGVGYSIGSGLSFKTPVGPLRIEVASNDATGDMRYNFGFGWKF